MEWTRGIYAPVFSKVMACNMFSLREHDYVLGDRKIGGNAQSISKDRFVHHTSFLWDYRPERMGYLKMPKKRPNYRGDRMHAEFLSRVKDHMEDKSTFVNSVKESLSFMFEVDEVRYEQFLDRANEIIESCVAKGKSRESLTRTAFLDKDEEQRKVTNDRAVAK